MNHAGFAKIGFEVADDDRISRKHFKVYWAMAKAVPKGARECRVGQRLIASMVKLSQPTVNRKIADLVAWGHVEIVKSSSGERAKYALLSVAFDAKPKEQSMPRRKPNRALGSVYGRTRKTTTAQVRQAGLSAAANRDEIAKILAG